MKNLKAICMAAALGLTVASCHDLDLEPKGLIYENVLFQSESGVQKYFALLYQDCPIEDFNYKQNGNAKGYATVNQDGWHTGNKWEAQKGSPAAAAADIGRMTASETSTTSSRTFTCIRTITRRTGITKYWVRPISCVHITISDW